LALYASIYHFGGIVVAPGYTDPVKFTDGNPYGTSHADGMSGIPVSSATRAAAVHQGFRAASIASALVRGRG
jgi:NAD(P)H dehydrogenase (quinone)